MNDETLEAECFGGTYKATVYDTGIHGFFFLNLKHDKTVTFFFLSIVNSYPETRHRYWSGYMLFYEAIDTNKLHNNLLNCGRGPLIRQEAIIEGRLDHATLLNKTFISIWDPNSD